MKTNPWLGLSSYDEEKIGAGYKFCGRSLATNELFSLVDNNILVTMYGKSGIGKSSLLQAGLFPKLRDNDYFPVYIRLGNDNASGLSYAKMIVDTINAELDKAGFRAVTLDNTVAAEQPGAVADDFLWHYFITREFCDERGRVVFPVIVIDQFEELFFLDKQRLVTLLRQIYMLIDDSSLSSSSMAESYVTNFRFLFSIREDDFFRLEDVIERQRLVEMKYNRYRLVELNDNDAADVIMQPAGNILKRDEEQLIVQRIIKEAKGDTDEINSAILSLLCSRLYDATIAKGESEITLHSLNLFLQSSGGNFFASFFDDVMKQLNDREKWKYIEDALVTDDGRRNSVLESQFNKAVPKCDFLFNGKMAMLRYVTYSAGAGRHVEMIHDLLANHLKTSRNERRQKAELQKMRRRQRRNAAVIAVALFLMAFFAYQFVAISKKNEVITKNREKLLITQSRYLASEAQKEYDKGNVTKALRLVLYALPKNLKNQERPYISEAEVMLRKYTSAIGDVGCRTHFRSVDKIKTIKADFNNNCIVTLSHNNTVGLLDMKTGKVLNDTTIFPKDNHLLELSPDGKYLAVASDDNSLKVLEIAAEFTLLQEWHFDSKIQKIVFSPDENKILAKTSDNYLYMCDVQNREPLFESLLSFELAEIAFSPKGTFFYISYPINKLTRVYNSKNNECLLTIPYGIDFLGMMCFSPDERCILFNRKYNVYVYDIVSGWCNSSEIYHKFYTNFTATPDSRHIVTMSYSGLKFWNIENGELLKEVPDYKSMYFSKSGRKIATLSKDDTLSIWNAKSQKIITKIPIVGEELNEVLFSPDEADVVVCTDYSLRILNLRAEDNFTTNLCDLKNVHISTIDKNGTYVDTNTAYDSNVYIFDFSSKELIGKLPHSDNVTGASISSNGEYIVTLTETEICVWSANEKKLAYEPLKNDNYYLSITSSKDDPLFFVKNASCAAVIDVECGKIISELSFSSPIERTSALKTAISPNGKYIAVYYNNGKTIVYSTKNFTRPEVLFDCDVEFDFVSFSPDERLMAMIDKNHVTVWNVDSKTMYCKPLLCNEDVEEIAFSQNNKYLATSSINNIICIWDINSGEKVLETSIDLDINGIEFTQNAEGIIVIEQVAGWGNLYNDVFKTFPFPPLQELIDKYRKDPEHDWSLSEEEKEEYSLE